MNEQGLGFLAQTVATSVSLSRGRINRDYDIAEKIRTDVIRQGEGQHISRFVFRSILAVEAVDLRVRH